MLGAAVADDVLGLIILATVTSIVKVGAVSIASIARISFSAVVFLLGSIAVGTMLTPSILKFASQMRSRAALPTVALIICLYFAFLATALGGLSPIIGAFAAGLVLSQSEHRLHLQQRLKPIADVFIPIFFVIVGTAMPLTVLNPITAAGRNTLFLALVLAGAAIGAKLMAGQTLPTSIDRLLVGCGMTPRGEVSLIFAAYGLSVHLLDVRLYSAILVVIMLTTFLTPPAIRFASRRNRRSEASNGNTSVVSDHIVDNKRLCAPN